ncbi:MAG: MFS transporter [Anaerolineae bacterium]
MAILDKPVVATVTRSRATWLMYLGAGYFNYFFNALGPAMPFIRAERDMSYTLGSLHFSAFAVGLLGGGIVGDRVARRLGASRTFWLGAFGMGVGVLLLTLASGALPSIASALVIGALGSLILAILPAVIDTLFGEGRTVPLTKANIVAIITGFMAPLTIGLAARSGLGWRVPFLLAAACIFPLFAVYRGALVGLLPPDGDPAKADKGLPLVYWAYWALLVCSVSIESCSIYWSADYMETFVGLPRDLAAGSVSLFLGAMLIGRVVGVRLLARFTPLRLLLASLLIAGAGFLLYWLAPIAALNILGLFVTGLGVANLYPLTTAQAIAVAPGQSEAASARFALASGSAVLLLPLLLGWSADLLGIRLAYGIVGALVVVGLVLHWLASRLTAPSAPTQSLS